MTLLEEKVNCEYKSRAIAVIKKINRTLNSKIYAIRNSEGIDYLKCYYGNCKNCISYKPKGEEDYERKSI